MKITQTKAGKTTITFANNDDCMRQGNWISNGHTLINIATLIGSNTKLVLKNERCNKALILNEDFTYRHSSFNQGCDINFDALINDGLEYDVKLYTTNLYSNHTDLLCEIYHSKGILNGLVMFDTLYKYLFEDNSPEVCSKNHDTWNCKPVHIFNTDNELFAIVMPVQVSTDSPELKAINQLHSKEVK